MFLEIESLSKSFGATVALDKVSLDVEEGEFVCFLGPSGCGKTTLLRCIAGLEVHDTGKLRQRGRDISDQPPAARDFGIVFQSYALFPNLTIEKNIGYGLTGKAWSREARLARVAEMVSLVGLEGEEPKYPAQLSGGQQQRVALARALAPKPAMLLLDEPLSALDAKVRERLRREVKDLQRSLGVTTIMVTHDQEEALTMADRVVVMNAGRIVQIGAPTEIYDKPVDPFVADFIGTMNLVTAHSDGNGALVLGEHWRVMPNDGTPRPLAAGEAVTCCIRPQHLTLSRTDGEAVNACRVSLQAVEYLGSHYRAVVTPEARDDVYLRIELTPEQLADLSPARGETLMLHLPPDSVHYFPANPPQGSAPEPMGARQT